MDRGARAVVVLDSTVRLGLASARVQHQKPTPDFEQNQFAQSFRRTLAFLKDRGAQVCVVTTPVSYEYYKYRRAPDTTRRWPSDSCARWRRRPAPRYVDFYDLYARPEFASYFRDMDHLNEIGAPRFTAKAVAACFGPTSGSFASTARRAVPQGVSPDIHSTI